jgi:hypothetical protein
MMYLLVMMRLLKDGRIKQVGKLQAKQVKQARTYRKVEEQQNLQV